ncbi:hypothetical protein ACFQGW_05070 [Xanthomonas theicola]|uniref:hypothetical protein n=1 Tax=Xanthomonas theicola TaxID=56464 RepID=UPI0036173356
MRRNYSYLFGAFVGWLLCGCVLKAEAQAASEYCYQSCFGSLDEAEAQMRAALPYGAYLVRDKINITGEHPILRRTRLGTRSNGSRPAT